MRKQLVLFVFILSYWVTHTAYAGFLNPFSQQASITETHFQAAPDFQTYIKNTQTKLQQRKVYMNPDNAELERLVATPFEIPPAAQCKKTSALRGILLVHGLADMPFAMRDLAHSFAKRCFLVRVILLPGHGTKADDLKQISRHDWLDAVRWGVNTLKQDVDQVYVGGFSLGGLLTTYVAAEDKSIKGVFAISPAFNISKSILVRQSVWLRHLITWADRDPQDDYMRYESMPFNAIAETYLLSKDLKKLADQKALQNPLFLIQSNDDMVIDAEDNLDFFQTAITSPQSRALIYMPSPKRSFHHEDARIQYQNSYLPKRRVLKFAHPSIHVSPNNPHYGKNGAYRSCDPDDGEELLKQCLASKNPWRSEFGTWQAKSIDGEPVVRLTYNPLYNAMWKHIDQFLGIKKSR